MYRAKKHFGQNFLQDAHYIGRIVSAIAVKSSDHIVEIGPGLGALTQSLLPVTHTLDVIEIDAQIIPALQQHCANLGTLRIHQQDVLTFDFNQFFSPIRIVGNLPYNISSPLLFHLIDTIHAAQLSNSAQKIIDMHFMLQKEVVLRMAAKPKTADYGRLSVMLQYHCQVECLFMVPPAAFHPMPKVDSAFVRLIPYSTLPVSANDYAFFAKLVKTAFAQRRKTLRNNLKEVCSNDIFAIAEIDPTDRAQDLTVGQFVKLANTLSSCQKTGPKEPVF